MFTLKAMRSDGSESLYEVKSFSYHAKSNKIDAVDSDGPFTLHLKEAGDALVYSVVYAMNSSGSTVGKYKATESVTSTENEESSKWWSYWGGGENPAPGKIVSVIYQDGGKEVIKSEDVNWNIHKNGGDVISYKIIE